MTGGRIAVIGITGRNFAAGTSGGISYVYDIDGNFNKKCNMEMGPLEQLTDEDKQTLHNLINNHYKYTASPVAKTILDDFENKCFKFIKVIPLEYKRIIEAKKLEEVSDG